jgi:hypothetical protein
VPDIHVTDGEGDKFVHFDEFEDLVLAIELVAAQIVAAQTNDTQWKWVIIGMQNAVQAAMVLALAGTDGCGALTERSQRLNREWFAKMSPDRPPRRMADYKTLLERVQKPELLEGPVPTLQGDDLRNLVRLNELRRQFAHYNPTGWGIELNYMLTIMPVALNFFEHLTTTQGRPNIHFGGEQSVRIKRALLITRAALTAFVYRSESLHG